MEKFEIKHRVTVAVLFSLETESLKLCVEAAVKGGADLAGATLTYANLAVANLMGAYLRGADLARANLAGADLAYASLVGANLAGANLMGANLARAYLYGANLADAKFTKASPEEIARLDQVREIVLKKPERLRMDSWHSENWNPGHTPQEEHECGSAHCIAGWLQALSEDESIRKMNPGAVGEALCPTFSFMFYTSDAIAFQWLKDRAYATDHQHG
jgi:hypothetical protein